MPADPASDASDPSSPIAFHQPALPDVDGFLEDARAIVESGWLSEARYVRRFETTLVEWSGMDEVIAVSNCSGGLIAALAALELEPGGEVILPGFTFLATWEAIVWAGLEPVVADVDDRALLDPDAVAAAATSRTVAILAVHMAGSPAPTHRLREVADRLGVPLLVDAAHGLGAARAGRPAGIEADVQVYSLGATKQAATGEAGAVGVHDPALGERVRLFKHQGRLPGELDPTGIGLNLRLPELEAALALRQIAGLAVQLERRAAIHERYAAAVAGLPLRLSGPLAGERSAHKDQLVWVDDPGRRAPIRAALAAAGIETRGYYEPAIPDLAAFRGRVASAERSRSLAARSFAVPIHARMTDTDVERVATTLASAAACP